MQFSTITGRHLAQPRGNDAQKLELLHSPLNGNDEF
ncbi:hypothetical protein [Coxiella burnetii]|uniref:Uncharacterized protein n=2 Tax=Coxiella burnetii TaxID=777 RepID=Q83DD2_COXBU|nr:hypothetical protein [Coxiella burnetii]NP_819826.1 hypothetical protein CBU_0806 [Coxiella burnetii RSA 493]AAO90340.1 hypothetical protein CBU_0806 [Coxiella burnetii RSA 493]ACI23131.1 hypothetical protein CBUD_0872a [Coxiella burnetii Dugway 5J108-111]ACJ18525.1 hypothetical protein CbuG_1194 [Coxiella burnetii CbuG_Q212]ACJ19932.1 hypothetical protein CbuK_0675 [Coxiella burnetii CbuK_Q154]APQ67020.1 hypothetical protein A35_03350 [Coxiella burnetii 'MSU Goat Q177']